MTENQNRHCADTQKNTPASPLHTTPGRVYAPSELEHMFDGERVADDRAQGQTEAHRLIPRVSNGHAANSHGAPMPPTRSRDAAAQERVRLHVLAGAVENVAALAADEARSLTPTTRDAYLSHLIRDLITVKTHDTFEETWEAAEELLDRYFAYYAPPATATGEFIAIDHPDAGIAWSSHHYGVFFDMILADRRGIADIVMPGKYAWDKVERWIAMGLSAHGEWFTGVRLIAINEPRYSLLARPRSLADLAETMHCPWRIRNAQGPFIVGPDEADLATDWFTASHHYPAIGLN